ncbi:MAG TPA: hypothetical protein VKT28_03315 [Puia sp.]|nr:hypothetical protein [Puia sp.]
MKKFFLGILTFVYITVASGIVVNIHYCMGRLSEVDYGYSTDNKCGKCGMENKAGCCHNEAKFVKLTDDQQLAKANINIAQFPAEINIAHVNLSQPVQGVEKNLELQYHSPPDKSLSQVYLLNCVFRI